MSLVFVGFSVVQASSYDDFFSAIKKDDARTMLRLMLREFDPNTLDAQGRHGLLLAISEESYKAAEVILLAPKINVNFVNSAGESALMLAALKGQQQLATQLIARGADVNQPGWTPLHYAATGGHVALVRLLLDEHAYVDAESPNGTTPLMMAAQYGSTAAVRLLLEEGAQPGQRNQQGLTALDFARRVPRPDAVAILSALVSRAAEPADQPAAAPTAPLAVKPAAEPALPALPALPAEQSAAELGQPSAISAADVPQQPSKPSNSPVLPAPPVVPKPKPVW